MITIFNGKERRLGQGQQARVFAQIDVEMRDFLHLLKGPKLAVLLTIALHADENGWSWPSYKTLQRETGYSRDSIIRSLAELCQLEIGGRRLLLRYQPTGSEGRFESNRYLIFPSPDEVAQYESNGVTHLGFLTRRTVTGFSGHGSPSPDLPCTVNPVTNNNHEQTNDDDDDDDNGSTRIEEILQAVWEGSTGRPASPDELERLFRLPDLSCPPTRLLALIPNLAIRVPQLTIDLLESVVAGELTFPALDTVAPGTDPAQIPPSPAPSAPPSGPAAPDSDPLLAEVATMYEREIGPITYFVAEELKSLVGECRDLGRWQEAFRAAVAANVRKLSYVRACLRGDGQKRAPAPGPGQRPPARRTARPRVVTREEMPPMPDEEPLPPPD